MNKADARYLNPTIQDYLRQQAIRLREQGKRFVDIGAYLGVNRNTVSSWWRQYQQRGDAALHQQKRGNKLGEGRIVSPHEEQSVQTLMETHFPDECEIDSALWTRAAVQALMEQVSGVKLPIRTVGEYLKRWGFTPQKPLKRAYEQNPNAVEAWLRIEYPAIERRARQEGAEIGGTNLDCAQMLKWVEAMPQRATPRRSNSIRNALGSITLPASATKERFAL